MRGRSLHRLEIAPEHPDFLADLLARADKSRRPAEPHWHAAGGRFAQARAPRSRARS